jgi:TolB protein
MIRSVVTVAALLISLAGSEATEPRLIAVDPAGGNDAAISPDGRYILASSRRGGSMALWMYDRVSGTWSQMTDGRGEDTEPYWSPDSRRAVFVSKRGGNVDLWIIDTRTHELKQLTYDDVEEEYPAWSPDGRSIVYTGGPWKNRNFFIIDANGGMPRPVLQRSGNVGACSFGPDSAHLICHSYDETLGDLIEVDVASGLVRPLTQVNRWYYKPAESPDGRWLAFTDIGEDGDRIRLMPRLATHATALPLPALSGRWPMFSNRGSELFFHRLVEDGVQLRLFDRVRHTVETIPSEGWKPGRASRSPDGRAIAYCGTSLDNSKSRIFIYYIQNRTTRILDLDSDACFPAWSPDGARLALTLKQGSNWQIAVIGADGAGLKVVTESNRGYGYLNGPVAWSPDGRRLTFAGTTRPYESDIFVAELETGRIDNLTNDPWYDEGPTFSGDGSSVVFMSTRGGDWTWGLFALNISSRSVTSIVKPDFVERRFPVMRGDGEIWWTETNSCLSTTFLVSAHEGQKPEIAADFAGVKWFEISADGRYLLTTTTVRRTEYWSLDLAGVL